MAIKFDKILGKIREDDAPGSEITGTLTNTYIPKATAAAVIANSALIDDGTDIINTVDFLVNAGKAIKGAKTLGDTLLFQGYRTDGGGAYVTLITITANAGAPTCDLADGVTKATKYIYRAAGVDVALSDGGTGASLVDPGEDRIMFWDNSATSTAYLDTAGEIVIAGTNMYVPAASLYLYDNFI